MFGHRDSVKPQNADAIWIIITESGYGSRESPSPIAASLRLGVNNAYIAGRTPRASVIPANKVIYIAQPIGRICAPRAIKKNCEENIRVIRVAKPPTLTEIQAKALLISTNAAQDCL